MGIRSIFGLALLVCGCGNEPRRFLSSEGLSMSPAAFVEIDAGGNPIEVSPAFGLADGELIFGDRTFEASSPDAKVLLIGVTEEQLIREVPGYDRQRLESAYFALSSDRAVTGAANVDPVVVPLLGDTEVYEVLSNDAPVLSLERSTVEQFPALSAVVLVVPNQPQFCGSVLEPGLEPFGDTEDLFAVSGPWDLHPGIQELTPLSRDRIVAATKDLIFVVGAGEGVSTSTLGPPFQTLSVWDPSLSVDGVGPVTINGLAQDLTNDGRLWATASRGSGLGVLLELRVDADGLWPVSTVTSAVGMSELPNLRDVAVGDDGAILAVGIGGTVLFRRPGESRFSRSNTPDLEPDVGELRRVSIADGWESPHTVGLYDHAILIGDAFSGRWAHLTLSEAIDRPITQTRLEILDLAETGEERWVAGNVGLIKRRTRSESWHNVVPELPPNAEVCTGGVPFEATYARTNSLAVNERWAFLLFGDCIAVLGIDRERNCSVALGLPGVPIMREMDQAPTIVEITGQTLFVAGLRGFVYSLDLSNAGVR